MQTVSRRWATGQMSGLGCPWSPLPAQPPQTLPQPPSLPCLACLTDQTDLLFLLGFNSSSPALFLFTCPPSSPLWPRQVRCLKIILKSGNCSPRLTPGTDRRDACLTRDCGSVSVPLTRTFLQLLEFVVGRERPSWALYQFSKKWNLDDKSNLPVVLCFLVGVRRPSRPLQAGRESKSEGWVGVLSEPLSGCGTLGKSLHLSEPQFPSPRDGGLMIHLTG